jgi:secondary thiamine-phosphate synthase enzyme
MPMTHQSILHFPTSKRGTYEITAEISQEISKTKIFTGLCHLFIQHTSASLILCENADPTVQKDLATFTEKWIPDGISLFQHDAEGPDDMAAHLRTIFTHTDLSLPIMKGKLALGTWQGIFLWEHRYRGFERKIIMTIIGDKDK